MAGSPLRLAAARRTAVARADAKAAGTAFVLGALADVRSRAARGERCLAVFDIDNTLADTRARTLAIAKDFDRTRGTRHFVGLTLARVGRDAVSTCANLGVDGRTAAAFEAYWNQAFWDGKAFMRDRPLAKTIGLARQAKAAGAEIVYLTGRVEALRGPTRAELTRLGLPDADDAHLFCKADVSVRTAPYKAELLDRWQRDGAHIAWFLTEGKRDIEFVQKTVPSLPCLLLEGPVEDKSGDVHPDTPVIGR